MARNVTGDTIGVAEVRGRSKVFAYNDHSGLVALEPGACAVQEPCFHVFGAHSACSNQE